MNTKRIIAYALPYGLAVIAGAIFIRTMAHATIVPAVIEASTTTPVSMTVPDVSQLAATSAEATTSVVVVPTIPALPERLGIPALKINAVIQDVGITPEGAIGTPTNFTDVAWYKYSSIPGTRGNAIIDGHVDDGLSIPGVFMHLNGLKTGDSIYVTTKSGQQFTYIVSTVIVYPFDSVPMDKLTAMNGPGQLILITCGGAWLNSHQTYSNRTVVTASLQ